VVARVEQTSLFSFLVFATFPVTQVFSRRGRRLWRSDDHLILRQGSKRDALAEVDFLGMHLRIVSKDILAIKWQQKVD